MGLSDTVENAVLKAKEVLDMSENIWQEKRLKYKVYIALPSSRFFQFQAIAYQLNITHSAERVFYPHLSTEAMPDFRFNFDVTDFKTNSNKLFKHFSNIFFQFGLSVIRITK